MGEDCCVKSLWYARGRRRCGRGAGKGGEVIDGGVLNPRDPSTQRTLRDMCLCFTERIWGTWKSIKTLPSSHTTRVGCREEK